MTGDPSRPCRPDLIRQPFLRTSSSRSFWREVAERDSLGQQIGRFVLEGGDTPVSAEAYALKLGAAVVTKHAPGVWSWLVTRFTGANLLVLGPGAAGKSSFIDYLLDGELRPAQHEHFATTVVVPHKQVTLAVGGDKRLVLRVKSTTEIPGQSNSAEHHANMVNEMRPTATLLLMDASTPLQETRAWIDVFCNRIAQFITTKEMPIDLLRTCIAAVNKFDLLQGPSDFDGIRQEVRAALHQGLAATGTEEVADRIPILPCVSVRTRFGSVYINDVIVTIARRINNR